MNSSLPRNAPFFDLLRRGARVRRRPGRRPILERTDDQRVLVDQRVPVDQRVVVDVQRVVADVDARRRQGLTWRCRLHEAGRTERSR